MGDAVVEVIKACLSCARVKASFREASKELQPLLVRRLGYKWGVVSDVFRSCAYMVRIKAYTVEGPIW